VRVTILGMNYSPEPTGIAPYTTRMATGLRDRGHDVRVVTAFPHYPQWRVAEGWRGLTRHEVAGGIRLKRVRHYVPSNPTGAARALSEISFGTRLLASRWGRPEVVILMSPALLSSAMAFGRHGRARVGVVVQDLYSAGIEEQGGGAAITAVLTRVERRLLRQADGVAVIHDRFKERCVARLGTSPEKVTVIRNWTHLDAPPPAVGSTSRASMRRQLGWGDDETVVLHSGAMGVKQGLETVVEAARLADAQSRPIRFVLLGDGGRRRILEESAAGCRSLQFVDPLPGDAYAQALHAADILLVNEKPGLVEMAVPSKLTSYFSTGRPVVAATEATSTTAAEVAASGAGVRIEPGAPDLLLRTCINLGSDPDRSQTLGARGPAYCATVLAEDAALDAYDAWVRTLARKGLA
jgi:glycosyltransferase involved in cell wall biosynthesis